MLPVQAAILLFLAGVCADLTATNADECARLHKALCDGQSCVVVTDFHDVLFKRLPHSGDMSRTMALGKEIAPFLGHVCQFGMAFLCHALGKHKRPNIEDYALSSDQTNEEREATLRVISPFELDTDVARFFAGLIHPSTQMPISVYGCSNMGDASYAFMHKQALRSDPADPSKTIDPLAFLKGVCRADAANEYRQKDDLATYAHLFDLIRDREGDLPAFILFIDDKVGNIERARQALALYRHDQPCDIIGYEFEDVATFLKDMADCFALDCQVPCEQTAAHAR